MEWIGERWSGVMEWSNDTRKSEKKKRMVERQKESRRRSIGRMDKDENSRNKRGD